jgi:hypothetical protein
MKSKQQATTTFRFVTERFVRENYHQLSRSQFERLRGILPRSIYWTQPCGKGGAILWNLQLLQSYLTAGADSSEHQAMVENFISTLPKAA